MYAGIAAKESEKSTPKKPKADKEKDKEKAEKPSDEEKIFTLTEVKDMFRLLCNVDNSLQERLFIIQVAVEDGWATAKDVAFFKAG